jgi:hypothetical protein
MTKHEPAFHVIKIPVSKPTEAERQAAIAAKLAAFGQPSVNGGYEPKPKADK